jgi:hypothetical protein
VSSDSGKAGVGAKGGGIEEDEMASACAGSIVSFESARTGLELLGAIVWSGLDEDEGAEEASTGLLLPEGSEEEGVAGDDSSSASGGGVVEEEERVEGGA